MFASTFAKKYNDPNKTSCTRRYILSAISFPPSETVQVHGPRASRHGYLYSICGKRDEWRGGGEERRRKGKDWLVDKSVQFFISYCQGFSTSFISLFRRRKGGEGRKKKKCVEHFRSICKRMMDILV